MIEFQCARDRKNERQPKALEGQSLFWGGGQGEDTEVGGGWRTGDGGGKAGAVGERGGEGRGWERGLGGGGGGRGGGGTGGMGQAGEEGEGE